MSGDVQPRRRKDKRKKKEEPSEETTVHAQPPPTPILANDDVNIHIHKERTLGGGICAKSVFFLLMIIISVIIGFTITEHRGQTDVDIPVSESRFASIFEGWTDKSPDDHDEGDDMHGGHLEEEEDDEEEEASEEHDDEISEEELEESDETGETAEEESQEEDAEEESQEEDAEDLVESDEAVEEDEEDELEDDDSEDQTVGSEETEEDIAAEESEPQEVSEEDEEEEEEEEEVEFKDDDDHQQEMDDETQSGENTEQEEQEKDETESNDHKEEPEEPDEEADLQDDEDIDANFITEDENPDLSTTDRNADFKVAAVYVAVAVKVGVGLSLFIVAYIVLVKKWKSDKVEEEIVKEQPTPDISRRNTFVPPPALEEVEQDIENLEEEYSEGEQEGSDEDRVTIPASKRQYEELRSTYHRSLTPDSETEYAKKKYGDSADESDEYDDRERRYEYEEDVEEEEEEEEEEEGEYEEEDDDYDEELMKKLEARYGKFEDKSSGRNEQEDEEEDDDFRSWKRIKSGDNAAESESDKDEPTSRESTKSKSGAQSAYEYENITNAYDYEYRDDLDEAQKHLNKNVQVALSLFTKILERHPDSPRGLYGRAKALDLLAEQKRSNEILQDSIQNYLKILNADEIPDVLFLEAGERCINRMRFIGNHARAISVHKKLINRFPNESKYANDLSVTYLTINRIPEARSLLIDILRRWPNNGFALVHYGFILKTVDNELNKAIDYLQKGIRTREAGVIDGRFYFHLGDALARLGKRNEAMQVYEDGVTNKVFLSKYQRSLYNVERLTARPWWEKVQTPYNHLYRQLEQNYKKIREEALSVLNVKGYFKDESENLRDIGDWKQFELYARGIKHAENCKRCPLTCKIIDSEPDAKSCRRGQVKFSVMHPGTHVWPHCGPTNCRLRVHLGLKVPSNTYIRVAEETRSWKEGEIFIFDDSFEHEVWHNGTEFRLVLIIDVWHPELTKSEKYNLSAI